MPKIFDHTHQRELQYQEISSYLSQHGIYYENWPVNEAPEELRHKNSLTAGEQQALLAAFQDNLDRLSQQHGYIARDLVVLNEVITENLEELLHNFERTHHHTEDEVRFIVDGQGVFTLTRGTDTFSVTVTEGDLISVPAGTEHYFTLTETRNVKAVRLFQTKDGWVAIYKEEDTLETR